MQDYSVFITQLDSVLDLYRTMRQQSQFGDLSDIPQFKRQALATRAISAIQRISDSHSTYSDSVERILKADPPLDFLVPSIIGVAQALRDDLNDGYIQNLTELVHADVFSDFLEMAYHLSSSNYKDPAAVLAGSTLESHLKKLATKNGVPIEIDDKPVNADKTNSDLVKTGAYSVLDQKSITAWLGLRNKAAHGQYDDYTNEQVKLMISGIQNFISRVSA